MKRNFTSKHTLLACYFGYITQAIVNNLFPLLILIIQNQWDISMNRIALIPSFNFLVQLIVDLMSAGFIHKIGYRSTAILAHAFSFVGLLSLGILPFILNDAFIGLLISACLYAIGGGLIEVIISPITEACPTERKEATMSLLHSFYCWGHVGVVLLTTLFFILTSKQYWPLLTILWAVVPLGNMLFFTCVPIYLLQADAHPQSLSILFKNKTFWLFVILMIASGAAEQGMSQWASAFGESALHVSKAVGDLAGPCAFAFLMGISRLIYGKCGDSISIHKFMGFSSILCILCYALAGFSDNPFLGLLGCALCGFSVGIFWPGTTSLATKGIPSASISMFACLALAGDIGCSIGPGLVALVQRISGTLSAGLLSAAIFPIIILILLLMMKKDSAA